MRPLRILPAAAVGLTVCVVAAEQGDILKALGTTAEEANNSIVSSLTSGTVSLVGGASVFKAAPAETRALLVQSAIALARAYTGTEDFARRYATFRAEQRPKPEYTAQTAEQAIAESQKALEASIKELQAAAVNYSPEMRKQLDERIEQMRRDMKEMAEDPAQKAMRDRMVPEMARAYAAEHRMKLAQFEKFYPPDPRPLIARRLREFLAISATVDFDAKLEIKNKKARFVDPTFEGKPPEWKLLFRAGKPAVDAARAAAQDWLRALGS